MTSELHQAHRLQLKTIIHRMGDEVSVQRPDGTAVENKYGKVSDTDVTYTEVSTPFCRRTYGSYEQRPGEGRVSGGRVDSDTPRLLFPYEANVQEDDHVIFPDGKEYALDEAVERDTHYEYRATLVTG